MCNQFTPHHKYRIDTGRTQIWARRDRQYSLRLWIPWTRNTKIRTSLTWPNHVLHGTSRKRGKDTKTLYCVDIQLAQRKGLKFYQERLNAIFLHDTLPAYCIPKVVVTGSEEILYGKVYVSPVPPPTISFKDNRMEELDSEVAGSSKDSQRIQPKPKSQLSRTVRPVSEQPSGSFTQEIGKDVLFGREGTKNSTRTVRPVDGPKIHPELCASVCWTCRQRRRRRRKRGGRSNKNGETREWTIVHSGLSHAVVKEAESPVFASSWRRSRVILIEKHFKPTCRRITSATHSATIRIRWSVKWAMQSYSSWAKQYQKCNVLNVFSIGTKEQSTAPADSSWLKANPEESLIN